MLDEGVPKPNALIRGQVDLVTTMADKEAAGRHRVEEIILVALVFHSVELVETEEMGDKGSGHHNLTVSAHLKYLHLMVTVLELMWLLLHHLVTTGKMEM